MALEFLGKDPQSDHDGSPTIYDDGDDYVLQGWEVDPAVLAEINETRPVPSGETLIRFPKRMMLMFPEVNGGNEPLGGCDAQ